MDEQPEDTTARPVRRQSQYSVDRSLSAKLWVELSGMDDDPHPDPEKVIRRLIDENKENRSTLEALRERNTLYSRMAEEVENMEQMFRRPAGVNIGELQRAFLKVRGPLRALQDLFWEDV